MPKFDGVNDYVAKKTYQALSTSTIEAWINPARSGRNAVVMRASNFLIWIDPSNKLIFEILGRYSKNQIKSINLIPRGVFTHIAVVVVNGQPTLYINGKPDVSDLDEIPVGSTLTEDLNIGRDLDDKYFDGYIKEVRIWNVARTQAEIEENRYRQYIKDRDTSLVEYWPLTENLNNGINGNPKWVYDDLIIGQILPSAPLDETALDGIAAIKYLKDKHQWSVDRLTALWHSIKHFGKEDQTVLFNQIFNPEGRMIEQWDYYMDTPIRWDKTGQHDQKRALQIRSRLMGALRVSDDDLNAIVEHLSGEYTRIKLDEYCVNMIYEIARLFHPEKEPIYRNWPGQNWWQGDFYLDQLIHLNKLDQKLVSPIYSIREFLKNDLRLFDNQLNDIVEYLIVEYTRIKLDNNSLTRMYQIAQLAGMLRLKVRDFLPLLSLVDKKSVDPLTLQDVVELDEWAGWMKRTGLGVEDLVFLTHDPNDLEGYISFFKDADVRALADELIDQAKSFLIKADSFRADEISQAESVEIFDFLLHPLYMFNWNRPNNELGKSLDKRIAVLKWAKTATIEKSNDNMTLTFKPNSPRGMSSSKYITLTLNPDKTKVTMKGGINNNVFYFAEFIAKTEKHELNIYLEVINEIGAVTPNSETFVFSDLLEKLAEKHSWIQKFDVLKSEFDQIDGTLGDKIIQNLRENSFINSKGLVLDKFKGNGKENLKSIINNVGNQYQTKKDDILNKLPRIIKVLEQRKAIQDQILSTKGPVHTILQKTRDDQRNAVLSGLANLFDVQPDLMEVVFDYFSENDGMDASQLLNELKAIQKSDPLPEPLAVYLAKLSKVFYLASLFDLTAPEVEALLQNPDHFGLNDVLQPTLQELDNLFRFKQLQSAFNDTDGTLIDLLSLKPSNTDAVKQAIGNLTGWEPHQVDSLVTYFKYNKHSNNIPNLCRMKACFDLARLLQVDIDFLIQFVDITQLNRENEYGFYARQAALLQQVLRARYTDEEWPKVYKPIHDQLAVQRRDALLGLAMLKLGPEYEGRKDPDILYQYFLLDLQVGSEVETSRIVQATASLSLYIQRCLMNLEPGVDPATIPADEWEWIKNYRVWEVNRKVFLYPENYIEPELRDTKTPYFKELEQELMQADITQESIKVAFDHYLEKFAEIANLKIVGSYLHTDVKSGNQSDPTERNEVLYLIGRTDTKPRIYYLREHIKDETGDRWLPWKKIDLVINSDFVTPVYAFGKLFLFWTEVTKLMKEQKLSDWILDRYGAEFLSSVFTNPILDDDANKIKNIKINIDGIVNNIKNYYTYKNTLEYYTKNDRSNILLIQNSTNELKNIKKTLQNYRIDLKNDRFQKLDRILQLDNEVLETSDLKKYIQDAYDLILRYNRAKCELCAELGHQQFSLLKNGYDKIDEEGYITHIENFERFQAIYVNNTVKYSYMNFSKSWIQPQTFEENELKKETYRQPRWQRLYAQQIFELPDEKNDEKLPKRITERERIILFYGNQVASLRNNLKDQSFKLKLEPKDQIVYDVNLNILSSGKAALHLIETNGLSINDFVTGEDETVLASPVKLPIQTFNPNICLVQNLEEAESSIADVNNQPGWYIADLGDEQFLVKAEFSNNDQILPMLTMAEISTVNYPATPSYEPSWPSCNYFSQNLLISYELKKGDALLESTESTKRFKFERLNTFAVHKLSENLFKGGIDTLLSLDSQKTKELDFWQEYKPNEDLVPKKVNEIPFNRITPEIDFQGAYRLYFEEIFFHIPFLIANKLNSNQNFADSQKWYHYIFNPTANKKDGDQDRYWRYLPFRNRDSETLNDLLTDSEALYVYRKDPSDPHAIAALRLNAYQKTVVMKYIDNLLDWGDALFAQNTRESINEAWMLYVLAYDLLGPRPKSKTIKRFEEIGTYEDFILEYKKSSEFLTEMEKNIPANVNAATFIPHSNIITDFCVPENAEFIGYWDRVEERLFKIRHSMNIEGTFRQLALFEPPIEPMALVRAVAGGAGISSALSMLNVPVPHYRYSFMLEKAKEMTSNVIQLGSELLAAIESRDAEQLAILQNTHEGTILNLMTSIKENEIELANETIEALKISKQSSEDRKDWYQKRIDEHINAEEEAEIGLLGAAQVTNMIGAGFKTASAAASSFPDLEFTTGTQTSATVISPTSGSKVSQNLGITGDVFNIAADSMNFAANIVAKAGAYKRRKAGWEFEKKVAENEVKEIETQVVGAQIQLAIAHQELATHNKAIQHNQEIEYFYRSKFSNEALYNWMIGKLSGLYFQSYKLAYDMAKSAEKALQYELPTTETYITPSHWDSLKKGLLSGESLMLELSRMEKSHLDQDSRFLEIEKTISMGNTFNESLELLKATGACEFQLREELFDKDYPGHYFRVIKSIEIDIKTSKSLEPYESVNATLIQLGNKTLMDPDIDAVSYLMGSDSAQPDSNTLRVNWRANQQVAISRVNEKDDGMFILNFFWDDRYFPFEGTGVVSSWRLEIPNANNPDLVENENETLEIEDVLIHLRYTAKFDRGAFKTEVEGLLSA